MLQTCNDLRAGAEEPAAGPDQSEDAGLGGEVRGLVPVIVQVVLREVGPTRVAERDAVQPSLVEGVAADLQRDQVVAAPVGVQQAAQLDPGGGR